MRFVKNLGNWTAVLRRNLLVNSVCICIKTYAFGRILLCWQQIAMKCTTSSSNNYKPSKPVSRIDGSTTKTSLFHRNSAHVSTKCGRLAAVTFITLTERVSNTLWYNSLSNNLWWMIQGLTFQQNYRMFKLKAFGEWNIPNDKAISVYCWNSLIRCIFMNSGLSWINSSVNPWRHCAWLCKSV